MKELYWHPPVVGKTKLISRKSDGKNLTGWILAAQIGMTLAVLAGLVGLLLGGISYLSFIENAALINQIGNLMVIAAFPLMIFGAHALDKINEINVAEKPPTPDARP